jgi:hypothetical protein
MKIKIIGGFLILLIAISNVPKVSLSIMIMTGDNGYKKGNYHFSAGENAEFSVWSTKGFDQVLRGFEVYTIQHPRDSVLYRNFKPEYRKFWRWKEYALDDRYDLPFREIPADAYYVNRGNE